MSKSHCSSVPKTRRRKKPLVIRYIRKSDRRCASHIDDGCFGNSEADFAPDSGQKIVVASQAGEIVGYIRFDIEEERIYLANVCTAENARGEGICKKMVRWLIRKLPTYRRDRIELFSISHASTACYASVGFKNEDGHMVYRRKRTSRKRRRAVSASTSEAE